LASACLFLGAAPALAQEAAKAVSPSDQPAAAKAPDDLAAIRAASQAFAAAFNKQDAPAVAALWTEDGDYIDDAGNSFVGRKAIAQAYAKYFADNPGVKIQVIIDSLKLLSAGAAIEDGRTLVEPAPPGAPGVGKYTVVHVKVDGKWLMSTVRDIPTLTSSTYQDHADLEWLIGTWTAEEHGARLESVCSWIANKSFVQRRYELTAHDGTATTGVQIIGWNPLAGQVQSWNFSSDGGHAIGAWQPRDGGWIAEMHGTTGSGAPTTAINLLTRLDDNAYAWQSVERTVDGQALPDTEEVVLKRRPVAK
jgi:uncharacterized protein (TIGR02246 family)